MLLGLPAGRVGKKTAIEAGMAELSEEVQLRAPADRWVELGDGTGFAEGKVRCDAAADLTAAVDHQHVRPSVPTRLTPSRAQPLLVIDPEPDATPGKQDAEGALALVRRR